MTPDFAQLGRETLWSADDWRQAWEMLPNPELWPLVAELSRATASHPVGCAGKLVHLLSSAPPEGGV